MNIVVTTYGHDDVIDRIAISTFSNSPGSSPYGYNQENKNAQTYCDMLNALEFGGNTWVFAKVVPENTPFPTNILVPVKFSEILFNLHDRAIQKVLREMDSRDLAIALQGCSEDVLEKVFRNVTDRVSQMVKEDMENLGQVRKLDIINKQEKILSVIRHLEDTGEILIER